MKDTELYAALLGLGTEWCVTEVKLDLTGKRVDIRVEAVHGRKWPCAVCSQPAAFYDLAEEQTWRHLDTCDCHTYIHARLPRAKCSKHNVRQVAAPWAGPRSNFTILLESRLIDTLKECDVTGCGRLLDISWDQGWHVIEKAVARGLARKKWQIPRYIGIDEKSFARRHQYETLV